MNGKAVEIFCSDSGRQESHFVHEDTLSEPIEHPVTGKKYDSKSAYLKDTRAMGLDVVGNDLLSRKTRRVPDFLTEEKILDRIERAEAIINDPTRYREHENRNLARYEEQQRLLRNGRD